MSELKRCPFYGGEHIGSTYFNWCPAIMCTDCGAVMTVPMDWSRNKEKELERKWNTRKPMERIVERLEEKTDFHVNLSNYEMNVGTIVEMEKHKMAVDVYSKAIEIVKEEQWKRRMIWEFIVGIFILLEIM